MGVLGANVERLTCVVDGVSGKLKVFGLQGFEAVSGLFAYTLTVVTEDAELDFDAIVGRAAVVTFLADDESVARYLHTMVVHIEQVGQGKRLTTYTLRLAPQAWLLTQRSDCRIFQSMSVPDILKDVLVAGGVPTDRFKINVQASYSPRDYCVQYRETDFDFISRLMEEEGIFYFFQHNEDGHVMVLADHSTIHETVVGNATVLYHPSTTGIKTEDSVYPFSFRQGVRSGAVVLDDFDFRKPALDLKATKKQGVDDQLEIYDYPGRYDSGSDGNRVAKVRLEGLQVARKVGEGESDCLRFIAGYFFTLDAHPRESLNQEYLLTRVETWAKQPQVLEEGAGMEGASFHNRFTCIPSVIQFRAPRQTPKPIIHGVQTAIVVGPAGEEIYPDEHGRVKVQFHWDRKGTNDEKSSCWIRVSQLWAGANWGAMFIPRIGHEVIVDFVEGDPDRPIITGRVYHGTNKTPYKLPDERTKSTIKSNSSKGGGGFNELRFEDKKGSEEIYLHGQKDWTIEFLNDKNEEIGHDETMHVGHDRTKTIDNDQTETIGANKTIAVGKNHTEKVDGDVAITIDGKEDVTIGKGLTLTVGASRTEDIGGDHTEAIGKVMSLKVGKDQNITVGGAQAEDVSKSANIKVGENYGGDVGKDYKLKVGKNFVLEAGDSITLKCGSASLVLKKDGTVKVEGKDINVKGSGDIVIKGSKVAQN